MIDRTALTRARIVLLGLIAAAVLYKTLNVIGQGDTSLMFIGLPAVLAVIVAFAPPAKSATGTVMKSLTIMLLLAAILLVEGAVCILMAAPLVYGIGALVGLAVDQSRKRGGATLRVSLLAPLMLLSLQGAVPGTSGPRGVEASAERVVDMAPDEVRQALVRPPRFDRGLPALYEYARFPKPLQCRVVDGRLVIDFEMIEPRRHKMSSQEHTDRSQLVLAVTESKPGRVVFEPVSDTTMMSHWARLESSVVEWAPAEGGTRVRWTLRAQRKLDPVWYFAPIQTYAAHRAADYLIGAVVR